MVSVEKRIESLCILGEYMLSDHEQWLQVQEKAVSLNPWFTKEHIRLAIENIAEMFLEKERLNNWIIQYQMPETSCKVGIVTAGNIPLVGFHDFLCGYISGHQINLKLSSKDEILLRHLIEKLAQLEPEADSRVYITEQLKNCGAYIATGSNNTARYFEQYFGSFPHIIRRNRTSVAILDGEETEEDLKKLAGDVFSFYGLGCRNVTQICVPEGYDFSKLLDVFSTYDHYMLHHKYNNNYEYHLAVYLLNKVPCLTNGSVLLVENDIPFSAVSVLHYRYYKDKSALERELCNSPDIQAIAGNGFTPPGHTQKPALADYADGVDTMAFLCSLK